MHAWYGKVPLIVTFYMGGNIDVGYELRGISYLRYENGQIVTPKKNFW